MILLLALGLAVDPARAAGPEVYPLRADVVLPAAGPLRLVLPPDLVGPAPGDLPRSLLLLDGAGAAVPYTVLRSTDQEGAAEGSLAFAPVEKNAWDVDAAALPVDALVLGFDDLQATGPFAVSVAWSGGRAEHVVYAVDPDLTDQRVELPHVPGPFHVEARPLGPGTPRLTTVTAQTLAAARVEPVRETIEAPDPVLTESGAARWTLRLPGPRAVVAVGIVAKDDLYDRSVGVGSPGTIPDAPLGNVGRVRRVAVGDTRIERAIVDVSGLVDDTLLVEIDTDRGRPLDVERFVVTSVGAELLVREPRPGPHALYGGGRELDAAYDLGTAAHALLRLDPPRVSVPPPVPNPAWVPLPTREGVDAPGPVVNLARFRWGRALEAAGAWARFQLDADVLAHARDDLGDLRVVDAEGRQVPFVLRATGVEAPLALGAPTRVEDGSASLIRVPNPAPDVPVATVRIRTGRDVFRRDVSILADRGRLTETVRSVQWDGPDEGGVLAVAVGRPLGDTLLLRVENGDNPPLPIEGVEATVAGWEVLARLPEGGARLIYGAPDQSAPSYDIFALREEVLRMPLAEGTLGPEEKLGTPEPAAADKALVLAGIGVLALGLLGTTVRVVRGVGKEA